MQNVGSKAHRKTRLLVSPFTCTRSTRRTRSVRLSRRAATRDARARARAVTNYSLFIFIYLYIYLCIRRYTKIKYMYNQNRGGSSRCSRPIADPHTSFFLLFGKHDSPAAYDRTGGPIDLFHVKTTTRFYRSKGGSYSRQCPLLAALVRCVRLCT